MVPGSVKAHVSNEEGSFEDGCFPRLMEEGSVVSLLCVLCVGSSYF